MVLFVVNFIVCWCMVVIEVFSFDSTARFLEPAKISWKKRDFADEEEPPWGKGKSPTSPDSMQTSCECMQCCHGSWICYGYGRIRWCLNPILIYDRKIATTPIPLLKLHINFASWVCVFFPVDVHTNFPKSSKHKIIYKTRRDSSYHCWAGWNFYFSKNIWEYFNIKEQAKFCKCFSIWNSDYWTHSGHPRPLP